MPADDVVEFVRAGHPGWAAAGVASVVLEHDLPADVRAVFDDRARAAPVQVRHPAFRPGPASYPARW